MIWVLWDILIPLIASFALGALLGWLIWSWRRRSHDRIQDYRRHRNQVASENTDAPIAVSPSDTSVAGMQMDTTVPDPDSVPVVEIEAADPQFVAEAPESTSESALRDMETANNVLIRERDEANDALEKLQSQTDTMQERIAELEAKAEQIASTPQVAEDAASDIESVPAGLNLTNKEDKKEAEELELLRTDLQQSSDNLERERKARRATELELLNIKNQHDKLARDSGSSVGVDDHTKALDERDEKIKSLQQQLDYQTQQHLSPKETAESLAAERKFSEESALPVATPMPPVEEEEPVREQKRSVPATNGHTPEGWSIPAEKPAAKERDKLTEVKGIGPVLERMLHDCGIYFYQQIADLDEKGMEELQGLIPQFPGRIERDNWVEQAKELQLKKYGEIA